MYKYPEHGRDRKSNVWFDKILDNVQKSVVRNASWDEMLIILSPCKPSIDIEEKILQLLQEKYKYDKNKYIKSM